MGILNTFQIFSWLDAQAKASQALVTSGIFQWVTCKFLEDFVTIYARAESEIVLTFVYKRLAPEMIVLDK